MSGLRERAAELFRQSVEQNLLHGQVDDCGLGDGGDQENAKETEKFDGVLVVGDRRRKKVRSAPKAGEELR
jgi:hypothetical protein